MKFGIRVAVAAVAAAGLVGCGGGAKLGKGEAAAMVFGASGPAMSSTQNGGSLAPYMNGATPGSVSCTNGGTATFSASANGIQGEDSGEWFGAMEVEYDGCTEPIQDDPNTTQVESGEAIFDGKMTMGMRMNLELGSTVSFGMSFRMQGRIDVSGDYSDYVDADITQTVAVTANDTGATSSVVIDGSIETSTETYTYDNETYAFATDDQP